MTEITKHAAFLARNSRKRCKNITLKSNYCVKVIYLDIYIYLDTYISIFFCNFSNVLLNYIGLPNLNFFRAPLDVFSYVSPFLFLLAANIWLLSSILPYRLLSSLPVFPLCLLETYERLNLFYKIMSAYYVFFFESYLVQIYSHFSKPFENL